jgi:hypothetical protein
MCNMSREINLEEKLSPEDHEYLRGRWDVASLRRNATMLGVPQGDSDRAAFWSYDEYESRVADAENAPEPADGPTPDPNAGTGSQPIPAAIGAQQQQGVGLGATGNQTTDAVSPRAFADESLADTPYEKWTNEQLRAEITKRNEMREGDEDYAGEEPMTTDGVKADLVARLEDDDEADAPE